jgi:hypothetical protein
MSTFRTAVRSLPGGRLLLFLAVTMAVLGAKLELIDRYGSDLPFWDQWDAEGDVMLRPYLEDRLTAAALFQPHNEHRPVLTRVLSLALFEASGRQWDARVQLVFNTMLHAAVAWILLAFAWRVLPPLGTVGFAGLTVLFFSSPVSWENTLSGFQSQFYFVLLFSALHLGGTLLAPPRSVRWWLASAAGAAALLSMASGLLSALALVGVITARALRDRMLSRDDKIVLGINMAIVVTGLWLTTTVPGHEELKASSPGVWLDAFLHQFSWPMSSLWAAPLGLLPPAAVALAYFRRRIDGPVALTLLGGLTWFCLQAAAIAYGRGADTHGYASRYCDTLSMGVLINALSLGYLAVTAPTRRPRLGWFACTAVFAGVALAGLFRETGDTFRNTLQIMPDVNEARAASVRRYVTSQDPAFFDKIPWDELPYPSAARLAGLLDTPALRSALPASVKPPLVLTPDPGPTRGFAAYSSVSDAPGPAPRDLNAWSSTPGEDARFVSVTFTVGHSRLSLFVASEGPATGRLHLVDDRGRIHAPLGELAEGPRWKRVNFSVAPGRYRLEAAHDGPGWLAFTAPTVASTLSNLAVKFVRFGPWFFGAAAVLALASLVRLWPRSLGFFVPRWRGECHERQARAAMDAGLVFRWIWLLGGLAILLPFLRPLALSEKIDRPGAAQTAWIQGGFEPGGYFPTTNPDELPKHVRHVGSWLQGDAWQGGAETEWLPVSTQAFSVGVAGYPQHPGCALSVEFRGADGRVTRQAFDRQNPGEMWRRWNFSAPAGTTEIRLVAQDHASDIRGWFAFSEPFMRPSTLPGAWFMLIQASATIALVLTVVWGPGLLWARSTFSDDTRAVFILGAGPFALVAIGILIWWLGGGIRSELLAASLVTVLWAAIGARLWRHPPTLCPGEVRAIAVASLVVVAAAAKAAYAAGPEGELYGETISRSLAVGDRSDSRISFHIVQAAAHRFAPSSPRAESYFSPWTFYSRGPLAGLAATPVALAAAGLPPVNKPDDAWQPFDVTGFAAYRIVMMALASMVIFALFAVLRPAFGEAWALIGAGMLALSPFGVHDILFTWPKWEAAAWTLLSFMLAHRGRCGAAGLALGVGFLYHPLALLWAPWLALWAGGRNGIRIRPLLAGGLRFSSGLLLLVLPWMIAGSLAPHSATATNAGQGGFMNYFLMADGGPANWSSWWHARGMSFANTFVPFWLHFFHQGSPAVSSVHAPSPPLVRFAFGWWTTLPLGLGLGLFALSLTALLRAARTLWIPLILLIAGPAALLIIYWGANSTGLMRECGHPLFAAWVGMTCVALARHRGRIAKLVAHPVFPWLQLPEVLIMLWLTTLLGHGWLQVDYHQLDPLYFTISALALAGAAWVLSRARRSRPTGLSDPLPA